MDNFLALIFKIIPKSKAKTEINKILNRNFVFPVEANPNIDPTPVLTPDILPPWPPPPPGPGISVVGVQHEPWELLQL